MLYPNTFSFNGACAQLEAHGYKVTSTRTINVNGWDCTDFINAAGEIVAIYEEKTGHLLVFGDSTAN